MIFSSVGARKAMAFGSAPEIGQNAPPFVLNDIAGKRVSLADQRGKVILLNFWATWCHACKSEMSSMNDLYRSFKDRGLEVFAVSIDSSENSPRSFVEGKGLSFPVLFDKDGEGYFEQFGVIGIPVTFVIDRQGILVDKIMGSTDWDSAEIRNRILGILNQR
jgi:cytochrome c biogenesis protein CcmG/thiol:disulfide interchange protein DsbE